LNRSTAACDSSSLVFSIRRHRLPVVCAAAPIIGQVLACLSFRNRVLPPTTATWPIDGKRIAGCIKSTMRLPKDRPPHLLPLINSRRRRSWLALWKTSAISALAVKTWHNQSIASSTLSSSSPFIIFPAHKVPSYGKIMVQCNIMCNRQLPSPNRPYRNALRSSVFAGGAFSDGTKPWPRRAAKQRTEFLVW
jgi:hypothetical protein